MNRALLIWVSTLAGLQMLSGAAALTDLVGHQAAGAFVLIVAAAQAATATYQHGLMTPVPTTKDGKSES